MLAWPYYGLRDLGVLNPDVDPHFGVGNAPQAVTYETVPLGEVAIGKGEHVHATDGDIGSVQGLVIDPRNHQVTHVLLQEGHLWGRKEVAIPITAVSSVGDGIHLNITKQDVEDLPPVEVDHHSE
jgi:sporulation protein YlmC with PRC-barrel domain